MATAVRSYFNGALSTATDVTFTGNVKRVLAKNLDGAGYIAIRTDGTAASAASENTFIPKAAGAYAVIDLPGNKTLSAFASAATAVSIEGLD